MPFWSSFQFYKAHVFHDVFSKQQCHLTSKSYIYVGQQKKKLKRKEKKIHVNVVIIEHLHVQVWHGKQSVLQLAIWASCTV